MSPLPSRRVALVALAGLSALVALAGCAMPAPVAGAAAGSARAAVAPGVTPTPHLVAIGDSLTDGVSLPEKGDLSYAWQVARALGDPAPAVFGRGGYTAGELRATLAAYGVRYGGATLLVVEAGTNDYLRGVPVARFAAEEAGLLADARAAQGNDHARLLCLGIWRDDAGAAPYDATIRDACAAAGGTFVPLAPLYARPALRNPAPDLHPDVAGQAAIAAAVEEQARRAA